MQENGATRKCYRKRSLPVLTQHNSQDDTRYYGTCMRHKIEVAVKSHTDNIKVWTSPNNNPRKDQFTMSKRINKLVHHNEIHVQRGSDKRSVTRLTHKSKEDGVICLGKHLIYQQIKHLTGVENKKKVRPMHFLGELRKLQVFRDFLDHQLQPPPSVGHGLLTIRQYSATDNKRLQFINKTICD